VGSVSIVVQAVHYIQSGALPGLGGRIV